MIAVTGGPGAGKTATLEVVRRQFCSHVEVLPEAASLLYRGGFPRRPSGPAKRAAQRAIYTVERELERIAIEEKHAALIVCDRGTLDGLAYWRDGEETFFEQIRSTREAELARYALLIHLRTPGDENGYTRTNPMRIEPAIEARLIDEALIAAWRHHPRRIEIPAAQDFVTKIDRVLELIRDECPECCRPARAS